MKFKNRTQLAEYFNQLGFKVGVEIGVARGDFSETLCQKIPSVKLYSIDPWIVYTGNRRGGSQNKHNNNYEIAKERLSKYDCTLIKKTSMEAVKDFEDESLDWAYIDGNHDYKYVLEDIIEWNKKVRKGGIVAGHDYYEFKNSGIIEAVTEYLKDKPEIKLNVTDQNNDPDYDERHPSFWWIKP